MQGTLTKKIIALKSEFFWQMFIVLQMVVSFLRDHITDTEEIRRKKCRLLSGMKNKSRKELNHISKG
jgi:hypothetical protein